MDPLKIIVSDDGTGLGDTARHMLQGFRASVPDIQGDVVFAVEVAKDRRQALDRVATEPVDVFLWHHTSASIDGLDELESLARQEAAAGGRNVVIVISEYAVIDVAVVATKRGADDFLVKPFTPEELRDKLRKAAARIVLASQAKQLAQEKREVKFQFAHELGHELKAPLNAVDGCLGMMKDRVLGDELAPYDELINRSRARIEAMRKLILDLLDATQLESESRRRQLVPLDLRQVAANIIDTHQTTAQLRGIAIELDAPPTVPFVGESRELEMLLNNLVSNAKKYNRDGGRIDVALVPNGHHVEIAVRDTGIGMTRQEQDKLFREFGRIRNEKTHGITGSGLGLSIVKKISTLYDGQVEVESEPNVGSCFTVRLQQPQQTAMPEATTNR